MIFYQIPDMNIRDQLQSILSDSSRFQERAWLGIELVFVIVT